jgi:Domain of unknown function (DUF4214)
MARAHAPVRHLDPSSEPAYITPPPGAPAPPPTPDGSAASGFKVGGKRVSWDAVFLVAGLIGAWMLYRRSAGGSAGGTTLIQGSMPAPSPSGSNIGIPIAGNFDHGPVPAPGPTSGGNWWDSLYQDVEHRQADSGGAAWWASETATKGQAVATAEFLATPEATVQQDYGALLGRAADPGGLTFYTNELASGMTAAQVQAQIANSPEAKARVAAANHV